MKKVISGIQQMGIGVSNVNQAWDWYRRYFSMDIEVFEEKATAHLMLPHTDNRPIPRHAVLAVNMQGGGGFEIWQQTKYNPRAPVFDVRLGDLGLYACKVRCFDIHSYYKSCLDSQLNVLSEVTTDPRGSRSFFLKDPFENLFQLVETESIYRNEGKPTGGVHGAIIGVSDIDHALPFYRDILEHDRVIFDETDSFSQFFSLTGGDKKVRRVLLTNSKPRKGPFGKLLGDSQIELVQVIDGDPQKIFKDRIWGDLGFIHLCFDTRRMDLLKEECLDQGYSFTVDSADSFDMGVAAGRFAYIEDPDGTLIEFVETHKLPILKKLGWYMKLEKRDPERYLPNWMVNTMSWKRKN